MNMNELRDLVAEKAQDPRFVAVGIGTAAVGYIIYKISRVTAAPSPQPTHKKMNHVLVTGANVGLGFESCRQLASDFNANKIVLCCRNETKAQNAIDSLTQLTGKPSSSFEFVRIDTTDFETCRAAATSIQTPLDGVILNAGGEGPPSQNCTPCGATKQFTMNVLGHVVFIEELIAQKKLSKGARIVFCASQAARGFKMPGLFLPTPTFKENDLVQEMVHHIDGSAYGNGYDSLIAMTYTKCIYAFYASYLAKTYKDYVFVTVSPGATTGTDGVREQPMAMKLFFYYLGPLIFAHTLSHGALRYMAGLGVTNANVITDADSGKFFASVPLGATGPLVDQAGYFEMFSDERNHDAANEAIHQFLR